MVQGEKTGKSPFSEISGNDALVLYFREIPFLDPKTTSKEHAARLYAKLKRSLSPELVFGAFRWSAFEGFEWLWISLRTSLRHVQFRNNSFGNFQDAQWCPRTVFLVKFSIDFFQSRFSQKLFTKLWPAIKHDLTSSKLPNDLNFDRRLLFLFL